MPQQLVPLFDAGSIGVIADVSDHTLPPEAWTSANNVRFMDNKAVRASGFVSVYGTPSVPPVFLLPVELNGVAHWLYPEAKSSAGKIFAVNSLGHFDVTRASGGYSTTNAFDWNGCVFQGTPLLNNGGEIPQIWETIDTGVKLVDLPNWPATLRAKYIGAYKNYLVALNLVNDGNSQPHRIRWSDGAAPGTVPVSWDITDDTFEAGELDLTDTDAGEIVAGVPFQGYFTIYKRTSTWMLRYIGGQLIMSLDPVMGGSGLLAPRAVCRVTLPKQKVEVHFLHNGYDVGIFDGNGFESVVHLKLLRQIAGELDPINFGSAFCFNNPTKEEASFCYPSNGATIPNRQFVWNYRDNTCVIKDWFGYYAASGTIDVSKTDTWLDLAATTWQQLGIRTWRSSKRQQVLVANNVLPKFYNLDIGDTADGIPFPSMIERTGLAIIGLDRNNQPKVDFEKRKAVYEVWPKIRGGKVNVFIGAAESFDGPYTWSGPALYDPLDPFPYVDFDEPAEGRLIGVRFEGVGNDPWVMDGYSIMVAETGRY